MADKQRAADKLRPGPSGLPRGQVTEIQRSRMLAAAMEAVEEVGYARMTRRAGHRPGESVAEDLLRRVRRPRGLLPGGVRPGGRRRRRRSCVRPTRGRPGGARASAPGWRRLLMLPGRRAGDGEGLRGRGAGRGHEGAGASCAGARGAGRGRRSWTLCCTSATREPAGGHGRRRRGRGLRGAAHAAARGRQRAARRSARFADEHDRAALSRGEGGEQRS